MKKVFTYLFFFVLLNVQAQKAPISWGKIPSEDLKMTSYKNDPSADAVILTDYATLSFDFANTDAAYVLNRHKRIKILKKSAFDRGDISIPYYTKNRGENIRSIKAQVITPDGKKIAIKNKDIFREKKSENWSMVKFSIPNIQEGSVIEYKYKLHSEYLMELKDWYFQEENIPTRWSELRLEIPEWLKYVRIAQGRKLDIEERNDSPALMMVPRIRSSLSGTYQSGTSKREVIIFKHRLVMKDVPALRAEGFITTPDDYLSKIRFQLSATHFPQSPVTPFMSTWPTVAKELLESEHFGYQFLKKRTHKKVWDAIQPYLNKAETPAEKLAAAYYYLSSTIKIAAYNSFTTVESLNSCFEQKKASRGELNLMLLAIAKELGIEAHPVLVSTRSHGKMQKFYPLLDQFNHVMVYVEIDGSTMLLDAGNPYRPIGMPHSNALNYSAWLVHKEKPSWFSLTAPKSTEKIIGNFVLDETGNMQADFTFSYDGYSAVNKRSKLSGSTEGTHFEDLLKKSFPDIDITELNIENQKDLGKALLVKIKCTIPDVVQTAGDLIYAAPAFYGGFKENPFKQAERSYPIELRYPLSEQYVYSFKIPDGYQVEDLPKPLNMSLPNKGGTFRYILSEKDGAIQVIRQFQLKQLRFEPEEYKGVKNFFDLMIQKQEEQIVFKKI